MRRINKSSAPRSLLTYAAFAKKIGASYDEIDTPIKDILRAFLLKEQHGLCAYCQQPLKVNNAIHQKILKLDKVIIPLIGKETIPTLLAGEELAELEKDRDRVKIEHHCERSVCNGTNGTKDKRLDYSNLFVVCLGETSHKEARADESTTYRHCDTLKSDFDKTNGLPIDIKPTISSHITTISYRSGIIKSSNEQHNDEINRILGLNVPPLKKMRKKLWNDIYKYSRRKSGEIDKNKMKKLIASNLDQKEGYFTHPFPALSEYMQKYC